MAGTTYRVTCMSQEQRAAPTPNTIELGFASDGDATTFGANMALVVSGANTSVDKVISTDYALPYPAGTLSMSRTAITDGTSHWNNMRVYDTPDGFNPVTRAAALIASGFLLYPNGETPTSATAQVFTPGPSV